jgi:hypothetical protein
VYSTYLSGSVTAGGASAFTFGNGIAVDSAGNAYVTGSTNATNFPTSSGAFQTSYGTGSQKAFVTKFSATGTLVYSTYLGGSGADGPTLGYFSGNVIAVDGSGNAYVTGPTTSANFPAIPGAAYTLWSSSWGSTGYITEMNANGTGLIYSTYLPGGPGNSLAVEAGQVYVTGSTTSANLPTTSGAYQKSLSAARDTDAFVAVLNPSLPPAGQLIYATYLGGSRGSNPNSSGNGIAVDSSGNAYVTGSTFASNFPTTPGAFQTAFPKGAGHVAFVAKINPSGSGSASLSYSTFLVGTKSFAQGEGIAVDSSGVAYVTGGAGANFPLTANATQTTFGNANEDAFVTTVNASGSALLFSTYLGGTNTNNRAQAQGIALDSSANVYVTGFVGEVAGTSYPVNFPVTPGAYQMTFGGNNDVFVSKISLGSMHLAVSWKGPANPSALVPTSSPTDGDASGGSTGLVAMAEVDQTLAVLFASSRLANGVPLVAADSSPEQTEGLPVAQAAPGAAQQGTNPTTLFQPSPRHAPYAVAVDGVFADLLDGGLADALAADTLLTPSA